MCAHILTCRNSRNCTGQPHVIRIVCHSKPLSPASLIITSSPPQHADGSGGGRSTGVVTTGNNGTGWNNIQRSLQMCRCEPIFRIKSPPPSLTATVPLHRSPRAAGNMPQPHPEDVASRQTHIHTFCTHAISKAVLTSILWYFAS